MIPQEFWASRRDPVGVFGRKAVTPQEFLGVAVCPAGVFGVTVRPHKGFGRHAAAGSWRVKSAARHSVTPQEFFASRHGPAKRRAEQKHWASRCESARILLFTM